VVGIPHPDFGEAVTAVLVAQPGEKTPTEAEVIAALKSKLANFKVPKHVYFVDDLPRNAMGKVQKNLLKDRFQGGLTRDPASGVPSPAHDGTGDAS
jgi:malonyl-CoA/methylmalonyl-CoA synthetase